MVHRDQSAFQIPTSTRKEVTLLLKKDRKVWRKFRKLTTGMQEELIAFCMGNKGLKITYDPFLRKF